MHLDKRLRSYRELLDLLLRVLRLTYRVQTLYIVYIDYSRVRVVTSIVVNN